MRFLGFMTRLYSLGPALLIVGSSIGVALVADLAARTAGAPDLIAKAIGLFASVITACGVAVLINRRTAVRD
ncbi:hypothetical protein [Streptomyces luteocolor]|uniref:hypothetical protein n=1 Tax=Streptomyces luteocolor TaxID=285500 RepID=UPI000852A740|nr:hypothetical protein [Streptomyces luteocolor]